MNRSVDVNKLRSILDISNLTSKRMLRMLKKATFCCANQEGERIYSESTSWYTQENIKFYGKVE